MSGRTVAQKLGIKPGCRVAVVNAPGDYPALVGGLPDGTELATGMPGEPADVVHVFARSFADIDRYAMPAVATVREGGLLWLSYPKGGASELNRDKLFDTFAAVDWRPVANIAVNHEWSAIRYRPNDDVKRR